MTSTQNSAATSTSRSSRMKTLATRVRDRAAATPDRIAMREKDLGLWQPVTWRQYWENVELVGNGLLALGVDVGDRVAVHCENRREWLYTDIATVSIRAITVGMYPTSPAGEVAYILNNSGAKILVAEDQEQVDKAIAVIDQLPDLSRIVYIEPRGIRRHYDHPSLLSWDDLLDLGASHRAEFPGAVGEKMVEAQADDIVTLVYTSGTTGPPKGVMLSAANVEYAIDTLVEGGGFASPPPGDRDLTLSYLPLCHVAERVFSTWFNAAAGVQVNFAESVDTVSANLREVQPTILFGVPRIWEKVLAGINIRLTSATPLKRLVSRVCLSWADRIGRTLVRTGGTHTMSTRLLYGVGWLLFFRALRERVGMRRVRYAASGAAPIAPDVLQFFMGIGVPMHEVYGMTENTAIATANYPGRIRLGTVGEAHHGVEVKVDEQTGEILTRHGGTFIGYWRNPEATEQAKDDDGWLHTGDVGEWVDGTHLKITDRMKDILITAGGKNIAPSEIENALKASPFIKEAVVIGDRRAYLTALIGIELDTVGEWARRKNIAYTTYRDLSDRPEVRDLVRGVVTDINSRYAAVAQLKDFRMLPKELDHEDGELTATQKVKRSAVGATFGELVDSMYGKGT